MVDIEVRDIYKIAFGNKNEGKMGNASTLTLLTELEQNIDSFLLDFNIAERISKDTVMGESLRIKKEQRFKNREETKEKERIENEQKAQKRQEEKDKKQFVKTGKAHMARSDKPTIKKIKEVKKILTEEQQDMKKYLDF